MIRCRNPKLEYKDKYGTEELEDVNLPLISVDIETYSQEYPKPSDPIICISAALCRTPKDIDKVNTWMAFSLEEEKNIIKDFSNFLKYHRNATLVTYNGKKFDLPRLANRNGQIAEQLKGRKHVDVLKIARETIPREEMKNFKLRILEQHFGVRRLQREVDGSNIHRLYDKRDFKKICQHNREDAENTLHILFKLVKFKRNLPLRSHQKNDKKKLLELERTGKNGLLRRPTQTGKTRTILEKIKETIKDTDSRTIVVVPNELLIRQWMEEAKKWGLSGSFVPITSDSRRGGLGAPPWQRKKYYELAKRGGHHIIATPMALGNDKIHGYCKLSDFKFLHLDEAHHSVARKTNGEKGWRINKNYHFLPEWQKEKQISGTTINISCDRTKALEKILSMESITDDSVKTQNLKTSSIEIRDKNVIKAVKILGKMKCRSMQKAKKLLGKKRVDTQQLLSFDIGDYPKEKDLNNKKKERLADIINNFKFCYVLERDIYQEDIDSFYFHLETAIFSLNKNQWLYKQLTELFKLKLVKKKTEVIIRKTKKYIEKGEKVLIHVRRIRKAKEIKRKLRDLGVEKVGLLTGQSEDKDFILKRAKKGDYDVCVMTDVAKEGLSLPVFNRLISISPISGKFNRKNLYGRICGGKANPVYYQGTNEMKRIDEEDILSAFKVLDDYRKAQRLIITCYIRPLGREKYVIKTNPANWEAGYKPIKIPFIDDFKNFIGKLGETIAKYHLRKCGKEVKHVADYSEEELTKLSASQQDFISKVKGGSRKPIDLLCISDPSLYEVKTSQSSNFFLGSHQAYILNEAKKCGLKSYKVKVSLKVKGSSENSDRTRAFEADLNIQR